ncbi:hypothetical protein IAR50_000873 [Cryptococcus sp. DSM 104548]
MSYPNRSRDNITNNWFSNTNTQSEMSMEEAFNAAFGSGRNLMIGNRIHGDIIHIGPRYIQSASGTEQQHDHASSPRDMTAPPPLYSAAQEEAAEIDARSGLESEHYRSPTSQNGSFSDHADEERSIDHEVIVVGQEGPREAAVSRASHRTNELYSQVVSRLTNFSRELAGTDDLPSINQRTGLLQRSLEQLMHSFDAERRARSGMHEAEEQHETQGSIVAGSDNGLTEWEELEMDEA